jgi:hypothetical protein
VQEVQLEREVQEEGEEVREWLQLLALPKKSRPVEECLLDCIMSVALKKPTFPASALP